MEQGTKVDLTVSQGPEIENIPVGSYVGNQELMANAMIKSDGFDLGKINRVYSETYREGQVIGQNPSPYTLAEEYSVIELWISLGPSPDGSQILTVDVGSTTEESIVTVYTGPILVYEGYPQGDKLTIPVSGEGQVTYEIYVNGEPAGTQTVTFESPEEGQ